MQKAEIVEPPKKEKKALSFKGTKKERKTDTDRV